MEKTGHSVSLDDISEVIEADPEIIIIGTGAYGRMKVPHDIRKYLESLGIELIVEKTEKACNTFNDLENKKKIVGAFHLTC